MTFVPDAKFPCEPTYDIPMLDLSMQPACLELPFRGWGQVPHRQRFPGTWHFYVEDYKFNRLWAHPNKLVESRCRATVEVNYSANEQYPKALFLADVYKKRWLARYWQLYNIPVFVDLNVHPAFRDIAFLGVPPGWHAFACKAADRELDTLKERVSWALQISTSGFTLAERPLIVVYSGGKAVKEYCARNSFIFVPSDMRGRTWAQMSIEESGTLAGSPSTSDPLSRQPS